MRTIRSIALGIATMTIAACSAFQSKPAVQMSAKDVNVNDRWHASLVTPGELAGAVQITGTATMAPGGKQGTTDITLKLANASPGGVHPWAVHRGKCGSDEGVFGAIESYHTLAVGNDGRGSSTATMSLPSPADGAFFVSVRASVANSETTIACGNFAPPTN